MEGAGSKPAAEAAKVKDPGRKVGGGGAWERPRETCSNPGPGEQLGSALCPTSHLLSRTLN